MEIYTIDEIMREQRQSAALYHEFLSVPALSMGIYSLQAGSTDPQQPHSEDEAYYILSGRGQIQVAGEDRVVEAGSIIYVAAHDTHHFHTIEQDLQILVFFAPAEGSQESA